MERRGDVKGNAEALKGDHKALYWEALKGDEEASKCVEEVLKMFGGH